MDYLEIANNFARNLWVVKKEIKLVDLMLFGSLANNKKNPRDVDLLFLHQNPILDKFQFEIVNQNISNIEKLYILNNLLNREVNLEKIISNIGVKELIQKNLFQTKYMNLDFFKEKEYRTKWIKNNEEYNHPSIKKDYNGEKFEETIFKEGKLWNPQTKKYDIPAKQKYQVPKDIKQLENQPST